MKLCIHCVHFTDHPDSKDPKYGLCEASPKTYSPVTGAIERDHEFCSSYRISTCGMKARFFVPILGLEPDHEAISETNHWAKPTPAEYAMGYAEGFNDACKPNYTTPPQRTWVGLTDDEIHDIYDQLAKEGPYSVAITRRNVARAIETKLKELNT